MSYTVPKSVKKLEDEIAELERQMSGTTEETEEAEQPEEEEVLEEVVEEEEEEEAAPEEEQAPVSKDEETFKKRYSDLRRHHQKVVDDLKALQAKNDTLEKAPKSSLPTAEEAEAWAKENPKAASIIRAIAAEHSSTSIEEISTIKDKLDKAEQKARIIKVHPDFEDITGQDEFHDWAETQPESVQAVIYSNSADDVIWALGKYKQEKAPKTNLKKEAAKSVSTKTTSSQPKSRGEGRFTESQVAKMSLQEYEANEDAINKSIKTGTFVYDRSGAAR